MLGKRSMTLVFFGSILFAAVTSVRTAPHRTSSKNNVELGAAPCTRANWICNDETSFCLSNVTVMCAAGTYCSEPYHTENPHESPCITGALAYACRDGQCVHDPSACPDCFPSLASCDAACVAPSPPPPPPPTPAPTPPPSPPPPPPPTPAPTPPPPPPPPPTPTPTPPPTPCGGCKDLSGTWIDVGSGKTFAVTQKKGSNKLSVTQTKCKHGRKKLRGSGVRGLTWLYLSLSNGWNDKGILSSKCTKIRWFGASEWQRQAKEGSTESYPVLLQAEEASMEKDRRVVT